MKIAQTLRFTTLSILSAAILLLSGCGGSSSTNESTSSIASRGIITGFGSVYVNGSRYDTSGTSFMVDDSPGDEAQLRIGMFVTVYASRQAGDGRSRATEIDYDNELKGPVSAIGPGPDPADITAKTLTILAQEVLVNSGTVVDGKDGLTFDNIKLGDILEVSGYRTASGLTATYIEHQDPGSEIEIKGHIDTGSLMSGNPGSFTVDGFPVSYDADTELDDIDLLLEGLFVEVEGQLGDVAGITTLLADKIEAENEGFEDDMDEVEVEGVISELSGDRFVVQNQLVDASGVVELYPASLVLANGLTVEVEGHVVDKILHAHEIKQKAKKIKIHAPLAAVAADGSSVTFIFNGTDILVRVNDSQTELEDETGNPLAQASDLSAGDFVEMEAFDDQSGDINAVKIERRSADDIIIEAALDDFDASLMSVTMLGIEFDLLNASFEDDEGVSIPDPVDFFSELAIGEFIKIKDSVNIGDGIFEKAELED